MLLLLLLLSVVARNPEFGESLSDGGRVVGALHVTNCFHSCSQYSRWCIRLVGVFLVLVPNYVKGDLGESGIDAFSMSNVSSAMGHILWAHWASVYIFTFITFKFMWSVSHEVRPAACPKRRPLHAVLCACFPPVSTDVRCAFHLASTSTSGTSFSLVPPSAPGPSLC